MIALNKRQIRCSFKTTWLNTLRLPTTPSRSPRQDKGQWRTSNDHPKASCSEVWRSQASSFLMAIASLRVDKKSIQRELWAGCLRTAWTWARSTLIQPISTRDQMSHSTTICWKSQRSRVNRAIRAHKTLQRKAQSHSKRSIQGHPSGWVCRRIEILNRTWSWQWARMWHMIRIKLTRILSFPKYPPKCIWRGSTAQREHLKRSCTQSISTYHHHFRKRRKDSTCLSSLEWLVDQLEASCSLRLKSRRTLET